MNKEYFMAKKQKAHELYLAQERIYNPYFKEEIVLNAKGFHHLQATSGRIRSEKEQLFKFKYLSLAFKVIEQSTTIQEYRKMNILIENELKNVEFWGMVAIVGDNNLKIRAVLRRVGTGHVCFWSVMPYSRIKNGRQRIYDEGIEYG